MEKVVSPGCIMILGAPNDLSGNLSFLAKTRLKQGYQVLSQHPNFKILLTGGFGKHFNETSLPHWTYAKEFLIQELAVSPESFLPEAIESSNTVEDIEKAQPLFQKYRFRKIIIVTSEFHLKRVQYIVGMALNSYLGSILFSYVPDKELDAALLKNLYEHENQALAYLKLNYRPTPRQA